MNGDEVVAGLIDLQERERHAVERMARAEKRLLVNKAERDEAVAENARLRETLDNISDDTRCLLEEWPEYMYGDTVPVLRTELIGWLRAATGENDV